MTNNEQKATSNKIKIGILGATGAVGQRFVQLLADHPWFEIGVLAASERSAGKRYIDACNWVLQPDMPASVRNTILVVGEPGHVPSDCRLLFSALPSVTAGQVEATFAAAGYLVCSNAAAHRMDPDVPLLIPEVNPGHISLLDIQRKQRGWPGQGGIITNPNCSSTHLTSVLKPLHDAFGLTRVMVVTMQAVSGAGYPGVPSLNIVDNVIPYIAGEEAKLEQEPRKLLGKLDGDKITPAEFIISAQCNRVPVLDGHLESVSVSLARKATLEEITVVLEGFRALPQEMNLPSAPPQPIIVRREPDRPQSRRDRDAGHGMAEGRFIS